MNKLLKSLQNKPTANELAAKFYADYPVLPDPVRVEERTALYDMFDVMQATCFGK